MGKKVVTRPDWLTRTLKERFDEKWIPEPNSGCWLWLGTVNWKGYGAISYKSERVHAHRISWFLKHGVMPPKGMDVCHHCDTPQCVNPDHLFLGTRSDNMRDAISKGRKVYAFGNGIEWSKIRHTERPLTKLKCIHGHFLSGSNLYISKMGEVFCKECRRLSARRMRAAITATRP